MAKTYADRLREKYAAETAANTPTSSIKLVSSKAENKTESSTAKKGTYADRLREEYSKKRVTDTSAQAWLNTTKSLLENIQQDYSTWSENTESRYESYDTALGTLLSDAEKLRSTYAMDSDALASIDSVADTISKTKKYIYEANKRNKQWKGSESYNTAMNRLEEADKINTLYGMSTQEVEAAQLKAQGIGTEELEALQAKKKSLEQKANAYSFSRSVTLEQKKAVQNELAQVNNAIQSAEQKSAIAYTTMDGQNITWDALYRRKKKEEDYAEFSKRDDWAENSTYKSTIPDENADYNDFSLPTVDWYYEEMNNPEAFSHLRGSSTYRSEHMTKEEMEMFNYIYHTQGRDAAFDWQRSLAEDLETLRVQDITAKTKEFASKSPLHGAAAWVGARLTSPLAGVEYVGDLVDNLFVPEKSMRNTAAARNAAVDSAITEQVDWNIGKWDAFDFGYGTLASAVDSALASLLPGGEVVLGLSAAASATNAALDRGMDEKSAVKAGIAAGVAESVFEHLSIGKFKKLQMVDSKSPKDFILNTIKSMGVNASEEAATEIANSVYDIYVNGEFSDYETTVRMMVQNGMKPEEARAEAKKALRKQIVEAAASGALMGLGFGVTGSAIGYNSGLKQTGKEARSADGFNLKGLANESLQLNPDNKLAQRILDKGKASDRQIGKLVRSNEAARHAADVENTRQAVTARLTELKATENVDAVADAVTKYVTGEKLTKAEQELIQRNRVAPQVAQEIREQKRAEEYMRIVKAAQIAPETQETESDAVLDPNENIAQISDLAAKSPVSNKKSGGFLNEGAENTTRKENLQAAEEFLDADKSATPKARKERAVSVVSLENGEMHVKRENGETVNAKSYRAVGSDQVYETIRNISSDVEEANTYVQAYAASPVSAETFEKGLRLAQMYGAKNFPIGELKSTSAGKLPENIRTMAYDHAQQSVQAAEAFLTEIGMSSESIKSVFAESPMDGRVDLNDMANGIRVAFQYGVVGVDKAKAPAGSDGLKLTDAQWNIAYQDGRAYARKRTDTVQTQNQTRKISKVKADRNAKVVNGVKYHGVSVSKRAMNERQRAGIEIAELLASMGMDVHLHQSIMDLNGQYVFTDDAGVYRTDNGFYRKRDGSIHIDVNAGIDGEGLLAYTLSHELTHFVEDWSSEKFKLYADTLISELGKTEADVDADFNRMINRIKNDPQYSELTEQEKQDIAYSELIAEYSESMLANTDVLKRIAEKIKAKDKLLAQKIHDFFAGIVKKLREAYKDYKPNSRLAQEAEQTIRSVDALAEAFADAVVDAADRFSKAEVMKETELSSKLDKAYNRVLNEVVKVPKTKQEITLSSPRESDTDSVQELTVNDVAKTQNGSLMVNINSRASGLSGHRKGEWPRIVSEMIRNTLSGKSIITEEGDIITVTRRGAREVGFGTDTQVLKTDARQRRDYSKVEQKMITAEHTASIIALSKYDTWSANNEDPSDSFKKDGLNYRKVDLLIDGVPHTATVVTALNGDPKQRLDYGEKFYDIENIIEKQTNLSASYGTLVNRATPHIIKMADGSSDRLTVTQKQRIVNNKKSTYSSSGGAAKTATAIAFEKALAQNSDHKDGNLLSQRDPDGGYSNRSLLANALESTVQHEVEAKRLAEYKAGIAEMSKQQKKLSELTEEWRSLMFAKGTRSTETKARIEALREEIDKTAVRINSYDKKLLGMEAAAPLQKVLEREKAKALKIAKEKEKAALKDQRTDFNERVKKQKLRSSVEKNAKSLMNMMSHPTKDAHVPNSMLEPLNEFLESIDFVSKQQSEGGEATIRDIAYTRALNGVRRAVEGQVSAMNGSDFAGEYALDINADFIKKIDEHIKEIEDATKKLDTGTNRVYAMNSAELKQLSEILRTINKAIRDIDKLHMQGAKARVSDLAADTKQELSRRKPVKTDDGGKAMWANYTPWHAFRRMGKSAQQIFKGLMQGQAKLAQNVNAVIEFTEKTYSAKEVKKWESDIHTVELSSGEKVKLTTAQLMSFYCLSQREHALDHLTGGGIRVLTIEDGLQKIRQPNKFLLSLEDITKLNELLMKNERAFAVAKELQKYMSTVGSDLINEISMARWDYMAATEKNYFPIKTDETSRDVKDPGQDATNLWALLNKSFTKGLTEGAKNAIYVESIFDVFADHMSEASEYNAFALPLVDAMRWFNYRERNKLDGTQVEDSGVHDTIKTVLGSAAVDYFRNLMTDINSSQKAGRHENIAGQILSRSKISSVGYNLRVMIQQPTAILRASLILDPGSLLKGTARIRTKELVKEMQQYSGIALWKSMGYYDLNVSRSVKEQIKHDSSFIDKANNVGTWLPGKMDEVTWARIWAAAKAQVAKKQKLKGEALLKATAELFEEIVYQTQVADSVLTRSSLMRSKSQFMKEATSFMAEPTVSLNILLSAFQDYEEGHKTWDKVKRGVMIGFAGYAMSSIVNACITALADAWRDDDEYEEFHEKYLQALFGEKSFFDGNLFAELNPLEKIVFVKDVFSVLKGYDVMPGYADLFKSGYDLVTNYQKFIEGRGTITLYGLIYNTLQVVGTVGGIGLSNIAREVVGVWNHTVGMIYPEMKLVRYDIERKNQIRSALEGGSLSDEEAIELLVEEGVAENEDEAYFTVEKWRSEDPQHYSKYNDLFEAAKAGKSIDKALKVLTDHGVKEKDAISTLKSKIGEWYTGTEDVPQSINKQETINMLEKYTDMKESEITAQVNKWTAVVVTGIKYQDIEEKFISGEIKESRAIEMRMKYGGQTQKEAAAVVSKWKCEKDTGIPYDSLREEFVDGNITEKEAINSMVKYGGIKQREAEGTVTGWKAEKETGVAYSSIRESFLEGELTESEAIDMYKNYGGMSQSEAEDAAAALQFEKDYGFSYSNKREAYIDGEITEATLRKALTEYGEKSAEDAENTIRAYDWMKQNPEYDLSESEAVAYTKPLEEYGGYSVADTGLDPDIFISYKEQVGECEGVDSNGDGKADKNSKKKQILALIDSLPITNTQKDALYFASGNWKASRLYEAPWR